jgi:ClpP class serine protease
VWTGTEAVENGLADEIGNIEDALTYAALSINGITDLSQVQIVEYPKPLTTLEMLMESLNTQSPSVLADTPFENIEAAFSTVNATETGKTYARMPYEYIIR